MREGNEPSKAWQGNHHPPPILFILRFASISGTADNYFILHPRHSLRTQSSPAHSRQYSPASLYRQHRLIPSHLSHPRRPRALSSSDFGASGDPRWTAASTTIAILDLPKAWSISPHLTFDRRRSWAAFLRRSSPSLLRSQDDR